MFMNNQLKNNKIMYVVLISIVVISLFLFRIIYNLTFNGMSVSFQMNSGPELLVINEPFDAGLVKKIKKDLVGVTNNLYSSNGPILSSDKKYRVYFELVGTRQYDSDIKFDLVTIQKILPFQTYILLIISFAILCVFNVTFAVSLYFNIVGFR